MLIPMPVPHTSTPSAYSPPATARDLPTHGGLRTLVEKHNGRLKGTRWNLLGCHVQGGVAVPDVTAKPK